MLWGNGAGLGPHDGDLTSLKQGDDHDREVGAWSRVGATTATVAPPLPPSAIAAPRRSARAARLTLPLKAPLSSGKRRLRDS
jgi:hypothetical protein